MHPKAVRTTPSRVIGLLCLCFLCCAFIDWTCPVNAPAGDEAFELDIAGDKARVDLLEGLAQVHRKDGKDWEDLKEGDFLVPGDMVKTLEHARMELKLPDSSLMRFDETTTFVVTSIDVQAQTKERDIRFTLFAGRTWAKVKSLAGVKNNFDLYTRNAVAGIRGTTYRVNESPEEGTLVRVYSGEIKVWSPPKAAASAGPSSVGAPGPTESRIAPGSGTGGPPREVSGPGEVSGPSATSAGPKEVAGPREVSMMEWVYIVRAMQQVRIDAQGRASKPTDFTKEEDTNDWVRWNEERDQKAGF